jgi:hypothetical protein
LRSVGRVVFESCDDMSPITSKCTTSGHFKVHHP